jgi:hypothetical protein
LYFSAWCVCGKRPVHPAFRQLWCCGAMMSHSLRVAEPFQQAFSDIDRDPLTEGIKIVNRFDR